MVTYGELYRRVRYALEPVEQERAAFTARELLSFVTGYEPAAILGMQQIYASEDTVRRYMELAGRILAGEPLAYILGQWSFYGLDLTVTPDVLIPYRDKNQNKRRKRGVMAKLGTKAWIRGYLYV